MMLVGGVFGQALGPLLVGFISDQLAPLAGAASLRWALAAAMPVSLLAAVFLWKAGSEMRDRRGVLAQASATGGT
jgi:MFS family permease